MSGEDGSLDPVFEQNADDDNDDLVRSVYDESPLDVS